MCVEIFGNIYPYAWNIFYSFFITLALFPGITADLESTDPTLNLETGNGWYPIILIALFNVGDMIGTSRRVLHFLSTPLTFEALALRKMLRTASGNAFLHYSRPLPGHHRRS